MGEGVGHFTGFEVAGTWRADDGQQGTLASATAGPGGRGKERHGIAWHGRMTVSWRGMGMGMSRWPAVCAFVPGLRALTECLR